jgi:arabinofuranosyltransferase
MTHPPLSRSLKALLLILFISVWTFEFWVGDDAFITFRSVENWTMGRGPVWNLHEKVQAFTHPLWFLLLTFFRSFLSNSYVASFVLSLLCTIFLVSLLVQHAETQGGKKGVLLLGFFVVGTWTFRHYLSSGLETVLLMGLIALAYVLERSQRFSAWIWLPVGLLPIVRPDGGLIVFPIALYRFFKAQTARERLFAMSLGLLPIVLWLAFSLHYFGELVPNTAYAKLNTGIAPWRIAKQGLRYFDSSLRFDPLLIFTILAGCAFLWKKAKSKDTHSLAWLLGVVLHLLYVIKVGGDFMAGRFWLPAFIVGLLVLLENTLTLRSWVSRSKGTQIGSFALASLTLVWALSDPQPLYWKSIANERAHYTPVAGIRAYLKTPRSEFPQHSWKTEALAELQKSPGIVVNHNIGIVGYSLPPEIIILDLNALSDPLLARLPTESGWRIGHFTRKIPPGYRESLMTGINLIPTPHLAHGILADLIQRKIVDLTLSQKLITQADSAKSNPEL